MELSYRRELNSQDLGIFLSLTSFFSTAWKFSSRLHESSVLDPMFISFHRFVTTKGCGKQRKWSSRVGDSSVCKILTFFFRLLHFFQSLENWALAYTKAQFCARKFFDFIDCSLKKDMRINVNGALVQARAQCAWYWHFSFAYFIVWKILKIGLSPTRELNSGPEFPLSSSIVHGKRIRESMQMEPSCRRQLHLLDIDIFLSPTSFFKKSSKLSSRLRESSILDLIFLWVHRCLTKKGYGNQRKWSSRAGESSSYKILTFFVRLLFFLKNLENWALACARAQLWTRISFDVIDSWRKKDTESNENGALV